MKLVSLYIENLLGVSTVDVPHLAPINVFAGPNYSGKSSIRDAIALALTGDLGRVSKKQDAGQLVREGASLGQVELVDGDGDSFRVSISDKGKVNDSSKGRDRGAVLPMVMEAQRFAALAPNDRRAFLYDLMGLKAGPAEIRKRLIARLFPEQAPEADLARIDRIAPMMRAGFEAAHDAAKERASEARIAWKTVTGEAYGSDKAKTWRATAPRQNLAQLPTLQAEIRSADAAIEAWQRKVGELEGEQKRRDQLQAKLPGLQDHAGRVDRIRTKLATDQQTLADVEADLRRTEAAAGGGPREGLVHELAAWMKHACEAWIVPGTLPDEEAEVQAVLARYEAEHGRLADIGGDADAAGRLPSLRQALATARSAIANDQRDLEAAIGAGAEVTSTQADLAQPFAAEELADAKQQIATIRQQRQVAQQKLDAENALKREAGAAEKKTADAAGHHAAAASWEAIQAALAPDGIPADILAEALGPLNQRLVVSAEDTAWPLVVVHADMAITVGGRVYRLLSESEQWRADAVLAWAIADLSGARMLMLDRFDVLDLPARPQLMSWLGTLAANGEIDTAMLFGTLKALPPPQENVQGHWVERGVVRALAEAA